MGKEEDDDQRKLISACDERENSACLAFCIRTYVYIETILCVHP